MFKDTLGIYFRMPDYSKGQIYKIVDAGYNKCYIGSTIEKLYNRMGKHRCNYKNIKRDFVSLIRLYIIYLTNMGLKIVKLDGLKITPVIQERNWKQERVNIKGKMIVLIKLWLDELTKSIMKTIEKKLFNKLWITIIKIKTTYQNKENNGVEKIQKQLES